MILRYIFHSGFLLETSQCILVFDYWMDPAGVMSVYMNTCKPVYVFSSHFHEDHFTKEIFKWKNRIPNVTYILSKDKLKEKLSFTQETYATGTHASSPTTHLKERSSAKSSVNISILWRRKSDSLVNLKTFER